MKASDSTAALGQKIVEYLLVTPKALALVVSSFLSGQLWVFVLFSYYKKTSKGSAYLNNKYGKTALGACWFCCFLVPIYLLKFRTLKVEAENVFAVVLESILMGALIQALVFLWVTIKHAGK